MVVRLLSPRKEWSGDREERWEMGPVSLHRLPSTVPTSFHRSLGNDWSGPERGGKGMTWPTNDKWYAFHLPGGSPCPSSVPWLGPGSPAPSLNGQESSLCFHWWYEVLRLQFSPFNQGLSFQVTSLNENRSNRSTLITHYIPPVPQAPSYRHSPSEPDVVDNEWCERLLSRVTAISPRKKVPRDRQGHVITDNIIL